LVQSLPQSAVGFPDIPGVTYNGRLHEGDLFDFGPFFDQGILTILPPTLLGSPYPALVPKTDVDGKVSGPSPALRTIGGGVRVVNIPSDVYFPLRFSGDGRGIFLSSRHDFDLYRYDLATDRIAFWRTRPAPVDPVGIDEVGPYAPWATSDGRSYVYGQERFFDQLYLVSGAR
jgi:hypothetical protein